jgi:hypothetical protein
LGGKAALRFAPALADAASRCAQRAFFCLQRGKAAVGLRDGAFRVAQRVARFAPHAFLLLELRRHGVDARAQLRQLLLPRLRLRAADQEQEEKKTNQVLALPCAATAAMRFSISAGSPR